MLTAVVIQVLVLVLTLAAAGGVATIAPTRLEPVALVDARQRSNEGARGNAAEASGHRTIPHGACPSLTAGLVLRWIDQGRGPMPPPVA